MSKEREELRQQAHAIETKRQGLVRDAMTGPMSMNQEQAASHVGPATVEVRALQLIGLLDLVDRFEEALGEVVVSGCAHYGHSPTSCPSCIAREALEEKP